MPKGKSKKSFTFAVTEGEGTTQEISGQMEIAGQQLHLSVLSIHPGTKEEIADDRLAALAGNDMDFKWKKVVVFSSGVQGTSFSDTDVIRELRESLDQSQPDPAKMHCYYIGHQGFGTKYQGALVWSEDKDGLLATKCMRLDDIREQFKQAAPKLKDEEIDKLVALSANVLKDHVEKLNTKHIQELVSLYEKRPPEQSLNDFLIHRGMDVFVHARVAKAPKEILRVNISKLVVDSIFHSKANKDQDIMVDGIVDLIIKNDEINRLKNLSPELLSIVTKDLVKDYKSQSNFTPESVNKAKDFIAFDKTWKVAKNCFSLQPKDHVQFRKHCGDLLPGKAAQVNEFINSFKRAQSGGDQTIDKSIILSKEFTEAMRLHVHDPINSKKLLDNLVREKPRYNPAELCKAYNTCMKNIQEIKTIVPDKQEAQNRITMFIEQAIKTIIDSKRIDNRLLNGLRDKMIPGSPFVTSQKEMKPEQFAKNFGQHFPVLQNILEKVVIDLHQKEYNASKNKQEYLNKEVQKLVGRMVIHSKQDAKESGVSFDTHNKFAKLEANSTKAIAKNSLSSDLKGILTESVVGRKSTIHFDKVAEQAVLGDNLVFIKKYCPNLHKRLDKELKDIKDPLIYSAKVAEFCESAAYGMGMKLIQIDDAIKLSNELGAKVGFPLPDLLKNGEVNPEFTAVMGNYNKTIIDGMYFGKYQNIINAIVGEFPDKVISNGEFDYEEFIKQVNGIKAEIEKYDIADIASFGFLNKQLERSPEAGPNDPYKKIEVAVAECRDQQLALKALAAQPAEKLSQQAIKAAAHSR